MGDASASTRIVQALVFVRGLQVLEMEDVEDNDMGRLQGLFVHIVEVFVWVDKKDEEWERQ